MQRAINLVLAALCVVLLLASASVYRDHRNGTRIIEAFSSRYDLAIRRPEIAGTIAYVPAPDWAAAIMADVALRDSYDPVNLTDASPRVREAWINAASHTNDELSEARRALLDAIAARPGWPFYQGMLGQTTFTLESRLLSADLVGKSALWSRPLLYAARGAPADVDAWRSVAAAYLQTWPALSERHRETADEVFRHAFSDSYFAQVAFPDAVRFLGPEAAVRYLPEEPRSIRSAADFFGSVDDTPHAWQMVQRWEQVEVRKRAADLARIEDAARRGDVDGEVTVITEWLGVHPVWQFDSPVAHQQAARVLELWPDRPRGSWISDPLGDVARYLLTRNEDQPRFAPVVARRLGVFDGVPAAKAAEIKLAAGDITGATRIAATADDAGSSDWSTYYRQVAKTHPELRKEGIEEVGAGPESTLEPIPEVCGANLDVAMKGGTREVLLHLHATQPTVVDLLMNRARSQTLLLEGATDVPLQLAGWQDKVVSMRVLSGDRNACISASNP
jgi:hypothetical protein